MSLFILSYIIHTSKWALFSKNFLSIILSVLDIDPWSSEGKLYISPLSPNSIFPSEFAYFMIFKVDSDSEHPQMD